MGTKTHTTALAVVAFTAVGSVTALGATYAFGGDTSLFTRSQAITDDGPQSAPTETPAPVVAPQLEASTDTDPARVALKVVNAADYTGTNVTVSTAPAGAHLTWDAATSSIVGTATPGTKYALTLTRDGVPMPAASFHTAEAPTSKVSVALRDGGTYGVGTPIRVHFGHKVTNKAAVEALSTVTVSPAQPGSWGWLSDRTMVWRPDAYWQAGTKVTVDMPLASTPLNEKRFGVNKTMGFTIGRSMVMKINSHTHKMTVVRNGEVVKTIPVSLGKPEAKYRTRSGVKVIFAKHAPYTMKSPDMENDPYEIDVDHAMRLTNSGEFIHSAPWSVKQQGRANVSHGCTNVSPANAKWLFSHTLVGDVVETVNTGRRERALDNGWGSIWNLTPQQWRAKSAITPTPTP